MNEMESFLPFTKAELIEIFYSVFPVMKELDSVAVDFAEAVRNDKTTCHFHGRQNLINYLKKIWEEGRRTDGEGGRKEERCKTEEERGRSEKERGKREEEGGMKGEERGRRESEKREEGRKEEGKREEGRRKEEEVEEIRRKGRAVLDNLIWLKEEALQIELNRIREMMELYGEFAKLFTQKVILSKYI